MNLEQEASKFMKDKGSSLKIDDYQKQAKKTGKAVTQKKPVKKKARKKGY